MLSPKLSAAERSVTLDLDAKGSRICAKPLPCLDLSQCCERGRPPRWRQSVGGKLSWAAYSCNFFCDLQALAATQCVRAELTRKEGAFTLERLRWYPEASPCDAPCNSSPIGWEVVQLVGLQTLDLAILVRVQASQPNSHRQCPPVTVKPSGI